LPWISFMGPGIRVLIIFLDSRPRLKKVALDHLL
jgi:hypothetical protein